MTGGEGKVNDDFDLNWKNLKTSDDRRRELVFYKAQISYDLYVILTNTK